jgi:hypothetical protein
MTWRWNVIHHHFCCAAELSLAWSLPRRRIEPHRNVGLLIRARRAHAGILSVLRKLAELVVGHARNDEPVSLQMEPLKGKRDLAFADTEESSVRDHKVQLLLPIQEHLIDGPEVVAASVVDLHVLKARRGDGGHLRLLAWLGGGPPLLIRSPSRLLLGLRARLSLSLSICLGRRLLALLSLPLRVSLLGWLSCLLVANPRLSFSLSELHPRLSGLLVLHPRLPLLLHLSRLLLRLSDVHPRLWLLDLDLRRRRRNINLRLRHANDYLRLRLLDRDCGRRLTHHDLRADPGSS